MNWCQCCCRYLAASVEFELVVASCCCHINPDRGSCLFSPKRMVIGSQILCSVENDLFIFDLFMLMLQELELSVVQPYWRVKSNINRRVTAQAGCLEMKPLDYMLIFIFLYKQIAESSSHQLLHLFYDFILVLNYFLCVILTGLQNAIKVKFMLLFPILSAQRVDSEGGHMQKQYTVSFVLLQYTTRGFLNNVKQWASKKGKNLVTSKLCTLALRVQLLTEL